MPTVLTPFRTYQIYNSLKLHFNQEKFHVAKYGTKSKRFNFEAFEKTNNSLFYSLSKQLQTEEIAIPTIAANLVRDPSLWVNKIDKDCAVTLRKYNSSVKYFMDDFTQLLSEHSFKDLIKSDFPNLVISGEVEPELLAMMNRVVPVYKLLDKDCSNKLMWNLVKLRLQKYSHFVIINSVKELDTIRSFITDTLMNNR